MFYLVWVVLGIMSAIGAIVLLWLIRLIKKA